MQEMDFMFRDTHEQTDGRTNGWTDRRGSQNSYLDLLFLTELFYFFHESDDVEGQEIKSRHTF